MNSVEIALKNSFQVLTDSETEETMTDTNPAAQYQFPKLTQKQRRNVKNNTATKTAPIKKPPVPAQTNPKTSPNAATAPAAPTNPNLTTQYLKLEPDTESLHATITKFLDDTNVPYYIITPKNLRPVKAVLRGLPINTDLDAIKTELTELHFQILNIYQLKKRDQARTPMPLFQIQLAPTSNIEQIWAF
ncbi:hypothetical protein CEXT_398531 [Caerostris extrusa]|uniref:Pre-C2HC domain-containing protein n=1 Tax=Caerostris extrusa TaxID=172846 RepID=A0AAV4RS93_CAEEX|nr:hypothetical protein CEXT_398531 [Caerostris extrusa]